MPLVIIDGPEAVGKTTIIDALTDAWGRHHRQRSWGPRKSWLEYCQPLFEDTQSCKEDPRLLIVWSRSWISRAVYNRMLNQGQDVPPRAMTELDRIVLASGGLLFVVESPVPVLIERRSIRIANGDKKDHPLDPRAELTEFLRVTRPRKWRVLSGMVTPEVNAQSIINMLVQRNPECRMSRREEEEPIDLSFSRELVRGQASVENH